MNLKFPVFKSITRNHTEAFYYPLVNLEESDTSAKISNK